MSELTSINTWDWNCGTKNDLDYRIIWGNNGTLTLQRNFLRKIIFTLRCWNQVDGWVEKSQTIELQTPTSNPHSFAGVNHFHAFAKGIANQYWGVSYIMTGVLVVISGEQIIVDEEEITTVNGCFRGPDSHYAEIFSGCNPPNVACGD